LLIYLILPYFHFQKLVKLSSKLKNPISKKINTEKTSQNSQSLENSQNSENFKINSAISEINKTQSDKNSEQNSEQIHKNNLFRQTYKIYQSLIQFWLISLVFFAYFGRMNGFILSFFGFDLSSFWLFLPFLVIIFAINSFLLSNFSIPDFLLTIFVFTATLLSFSFVGFLQVDRTAKRLFSDNSLDFIFNLPIFFWFFISILTIFTTTFFRLKDIFWKEFWLILTLITVFFVASYNLPFVYWYQALVFVIIWHLIFQFSIKDSKKNPKERFLSFIYHLILTIIVVIFAYFGSRI